MIISRQWISHHKIIQHISIIPLQQVINHIFLTFGLHFLLYNLIIFYQGNRTIGISLTSFTRFVLNSETLPLILNPLVENPRITCFGFRLIRTPIIPTHLIVDFVYITVPLINQHSWYQFLQKSQTNLLL